MYRSKYLLIMFRSSVGAWFIARSRFLGNLLEISASPRVFPDVCWIIVGSSSVVARSAL